MKSFIVVLALVSCALAGSVGPASQQRDKRGLLGYGALGYSGYGGLSYGGYGGLGYGGLGYASAAPAQLVTVNKVVNTARVVDVPQLVNVRRVVSVPQVVTVNKLVAAPVVYSGYGAGWGGWW